jgi:hypothetical protein
MSSWPLLAHEVLLDPSFQLSEEGGADDSVGQLVRATFHRAFWDGLADEILDVPKCSARVLKVLAEIRNGLAGLLGPVEKMTISKVVDLDLIKQQIDAGHYSWGDYVALFVSIASLIQRVQSDSRRVQAATASGWQELETALKTADDLAQPILICRCLEFLLGRVRAMRVDSANARLRRIAPMIKGHGTEYERGKFSGKLSRGVLTLEHTTAWLRGFLMRLSTQHPEVLAAIMRGSSSAFVAAHAAAVMDLVRNEQLAHEVLLEQTFQLTSEGDCEEDSVARVCTLPAHVWLRLNTSYKRGKYQHHVSDGTCTLNVLKQLHKFYLACVLEGSCEHGSKEHGHCGGNGGDCSREGQGDKCGQDGINDSGRRRGGGDKEPNDGVPQNTGGEGWGVCSICHDALGAAAAPRCWECRQAMGHLECVIMWLVCYSNTCPLCRTLDPLLAQETRGDGRLDPGAPAGDPGDGPLLQMGGSGGGSEMQLDEALAQALVALQWAGGAIAITAAAGNGGQDE